MAAAATTTVVLSAAYTLWMVKRVFFGPVVNIVTTRSCAWNMARVLTFVKACVEKSNIPIHNNMGMGVGGVPLSDTPPVDAVTRASKAAVEICRLDGI